MDESGGERLETNRRPNTNQTQTRPTLLVEMMGVFLGQCGAMSSKNLREYCTGTAWMMKEASLSASSALVVARMVGGSVMSLRYVGCLWWVLMCWATSSLRTRTVTGMDFLPSTDARASPKEPPPSTANRTGYGNGRPLRLRMRIVVCVDLIVEWVGGWMEWNGLRDGGMCLQRSGHVPFHMAAWCAGSGCRPRPLPCP